VSLSKNADSEDHQPIAEIDRLIHEPARLMIMAYLYVVESADFIFLMHHTGLTHGNLSSHMSKLEAAGYIEIVKEFVDRKPISHEYTDHNTIINIFMTIISDSVLRIKKVA
jgi:DNA-binding transcriptional ArsR family regulator